MSGDPLVSVLGFVQGAQHELLLFAAVWFALGAVDELLVDGLWLGLAASGRARSRPVPPGAASAPLAGVQAVFVPAWQEANVVGAMISHALRAWPQADLRLYVGCYRNDAATLRAVMAVPRDPRLRVVYHDADGPTTKADCLNRLYAALCADEARGGFRARGIILHDAEDMVHPAALGLLDAALDEADFVQLPVRPEPQPRSRWIAGHYADEFAEAHGKAMVVRDWLGTPIPAAGVGCAFSRRAIDLLAARRSAQARPGSRAAGRSVGPFAIESLTEDYECGILIGELGQRARFLRCRDDDGQLVATRAYFPSDLDAAARQKTRWLHGIAFQGWDRLGWSVRPADLWMRLRDRRGPMLALVFSAAYLILLLTPFVLLAEWRGMLVARPFSPLLRGLLWFNVLSLVVRLAFRFAFTAREYGWREGLRAVIRIQVSNIIAIMSGRRAVWAYFRSLRGAGLVWDKTLHAEHPAFAGQAG